MVRTNLSELKLRQLRRIATELRIRGRWRMRKQKLVEAIAASQGTEALEKALPSEPAPASVAPQADAAAPQAEPASATEPEAAPPSEPAEPSEDEVFIDRGRALPDGYGATRLRVMTRDPDTLFVYWELPDKPPEGGWEVTALDAESVLMGTARLGAEETRCYLNLPAEEVQRVQLRPFSAAPRERIPAPVSDGYTVILSREQAQPVPQASDNTESGDKAAQENGSEQATSREHLPTTREETGERWVVVGMDGVASAPAPASALCGCGDAQSGPDAPGRETSQGPVESGHSSHSVSRRQRR